MSFDESKHPRDDDGKFTDGTAESSADRLKRIREKYFSHLTEGQERGIISLRNMPNGMRRSALHILTKKEIEIVKSEIVAIGADPNKFKFNIGSRTSYIDELDCILIRGDIFPDENSTHPTDQLSVRAVLAHEYYGHRTFRGTQAQIGSWNDEFRASYTAAKLCPNLSAEERRLLVLDALQRAKDAGVSVKLNIFMWRILYGEAND